MALRSRGSYNVQFQLEGNWFKFNQIADNNNILLAMAARSGQREFAEMYRDNVKANINTGGKRFGYPQNSGMYLYKKALYGGGSTAMNWSKAFYNAVEIKENSVGTRFMVGIPNGIKRSPYYSGDTNRLSVSEYANVLEHGAGKIPARPVFSDTFSKQMGGRVGLKAYLELAIIRKYGTQGIKVDRI